MRWTPTTDEIRTSETAIAYLEDRLRYWVNEQRVADERAEQYRQQWEKACQHIEDLLLNGSRDATYRATVYLSGFETRGQPQADEGAAE